jgi:hypothetical protein
MVLFCWFAHLFAGHYLQGGSLNRGLFFADLLPPQFGAMSGKISEN